MPRQMSDLLSEIVMANKLSPKDEMVEGFVDGMTIGRSDPVFNRHEMYGDPDTGEGGIVRRLYEMMKKENPGHEVMVVTYPKEGGYRVMDPDCYAELLPENVVNAFSILPRPLYRDAMKWMGPDRIVTPVDEFEVTLPPMSVLGLDHEVYRCGPDAVFVAVARVAVRDDGEGYDTYIDRLLYKTPLPGMADEVLDNLAYDMNDNHVVMDIILQAFESYGRQILGIS